MNRRSIIALIFFLPWSATTLATEVKDNAVSVCECLKISRQDPLMAACKELSDRLEDSDWSTEAKACREKEMQELATHIQNCTEIVQEFIHPWTGEKLSRSITGMENGTCHYIVEMPQGGKMECRFPSDRLDDIAYYFNNSSLFEKAQTEISTSVVDGKTVNKTRFFIDGKEIVNPMQESLDNGECMTYMPKM